MSYSEKEMIEGYIDGSRPDAIEPSDNRSASYRHGWLNGRDDRRGKPRASAAKLRAEGEAARAADQV